MTIKEKTIIGSTTINIFILIEFLIFYSVLFKETRSQKMKSIMKVASCLFLSLVGYIWIFKSGLQQEPNILAIAESFLIILSCLHYYYQLSKYSSANNFFREPLFWVVTGMFFFFGSTTPFLLADDFMFSNFPKVYYHIYSIVFIAYSILFSTFIIATRLQIKKGIAQKK